MSAENISGLTSAASVDVDPIWATLLSKALEGKNLQDLISNICVAGTVAPADVTMSAGKEAVTVASTKEQEPEKSEEKEESDDDMV